MRVEPHSNDHIFLETRLIAIIIVPVLLTAFWMLNLAYASQHEQFAWTITPSMSARLLGSAYFGGAYFFARVALAKQWHRIHTGIPPVIAFASILGITTLLHWDRFHHELFTFQLWAFLYLSLPPIIAFVWYRNRKTDPYTPDATYPPIPQMMRRFLIGMGLILLLVSVLLFVAPRIVIPVWFWTLTPLTARTMAALFILPALVAIGIAWDGRWTSAKITLEAQLISLAMIVISALQAQSDFVTDVSQYLFIGSMSVLGILLLAFYGWMERQANADHPSTVNLIS